MAAGDRGAHRGWQAALACCPPVDDLSALAIGGSGGRAIGCAGLPLLLDAVGRQLTGGITLSGGGEGLFAGEVPSRTRCDRDGATARYRGAAVRNTGCGEARRPGGDRRESQARRRCRLVTVIVMAARLDAVCITALEPRRLADFWAEALRWRVDDPSAGRDRSRTARRHGVQGADRAHGRAEGSTQPSPLRSDDERPR